MGLKDKFRSFIERFRSGSSRFDPAQFDDPVAAMTKWHPLKSGGANFRTHKLVQVSLDRVQFKLSLGAILFCGIFLVAGLAIMFGFPINNMVKGNDVWQGYKTILVFLFGSVFALAGGGFCIIFHLRRYSINGSGISGKDEKAPIR